MRLLQSWRTCLLATAAVASLCVAAGAGRASAETIRGSITGTVTDETGAALAAVTVTVTHVETGIATTALTTAQGSYTLPLLASGLSPRIYSLSRRLLSPYRVRDSPLPAFQKSAWAMAPTQAVDTFVQWSSRRSSDVMQMRRSA